jgi:tRNA(Leu) C34 or U34 (ribose-2'-O)-methylase TrmL
MMYSQFYPDVEVLKACDGILSLPTYGIKNSLNVANCVSVVIWDTLRRWNSNDASKMQVIVNRVVDN